MISNEEILKVVLPNNHELEQKDKFDIKKEEIRCIKKLKKEALKQCFMSARQTNLNDFINIS
ncbi:hypothetical protein C1646_774010 [Rhizophagus diaphanus]|nr:hypothetical protein C1646_774010 [Rhizophagus diaphanus] [Rhizophagus sp. MUCL 43196]